MCVDRIPVGDSSFACEDFAAFKPWPPAAGDRSPRCCHALTVIGCLLLPRPAGGIGCLLPPRPARGSPAPMLPRPAGDRPPRCCPRPAGDRPPRCYPRPAGDRLPAAGDTLRPLPRSAPPPRRHAALRTRPASPHVATLRVALILRARCPALRRPPRNPYGVPLRSAPRAPCTPAVTPTGLPPPHPAPCASCALRLPM